MKVDFGGEYIDDKEYKGSPYRHIIKESYICVDRENMIFKKFTDILLNRGDVEDKTDVHIKRHNVRGLRKMLKLINDNKGKKIKNTPYLARKKVIRERKEKEEKPKEKEGKKKVIPLSPIEKELQEFPELLSLIINRGVVNYKKAGIPQTIRNVENLGISERLNPFEAVNKFGKVNHKLFGFTTMGTNISRIPTKNFGSIGDFNIDSLPHSFGRLKGTEITWLSYDNKHIRNKQMISRLCASNVLSTWCYVLDIDYLDTATPDRISGINMWGIDAEEASQLFITGDMMKRMIKDIIFLTRNIKRQKIYEKISMGLASIQLYNVLQHKRYNKEGKLDDIINTIKNRLYYTYQVGERIIWDYPKYSVEYLNEFIDRLDSGEYITDIIIPLMYERRGIKFKFPLKNVDTRIKPTSNEEHQKAKDDYDLTQHLFTEER